MKEASQYDEKWQQILNKIKEINGDLAKYINVNKKDLNYFRIPKVSKNTIINTKLASLGHCLNWMNKFHKNEVAQYLEAESLIKDTERAFYKAVGITDLNEQNYINKIKAKMLESWNKRPKVLKGKQSEKKKPTQNNV